MGNVMQVFDPSAGTGGFASVLGVGALVLVAAVLFYPGPEPHRRLLALVRAWRRPRPDPPARPRKRQRRGS